MNILKKLIGVTVFLAALCTALLVTRYYDLSSNPAPKTLSSTTVPPPALDALPNSAPPQDSVSYKVQLISIDLNSNKSYTTLTLKREPTHPAPEKLWVWTYFFTPDRPRQSWSSTPVELRQPFANGDNTTVNTIEVCHWCNDRRAPKAGYYAQVNISTRSSALAVLPDAQLNSDIAAAVPVLVQGDSQPSR